MTTSAQDTALARPVVYPVYFVEFQFQTSTARLSTMNQTINWGGFDWLGIGTMGSIDAVQESDSLTSSPMNFSINAAQPSWLALAVGPVESYRGYPAKMYFCPMTENFQLIDTPVMCWSGIMDMVSVGINGDSGSITLKCETSAYGLKRRPVLRLNAAQHKARHPTDTGFDYLTGLIANPAVWLSTRFQKQ